MPYRPDYLRLNKFYRYIVRVFGFGKTVKAMSCWFDNHSESQRCEASEAICQTNKKMTDSRKNPKVPMSALFLAMFLGILLRFGSKRSITKVSKRHQVRKFLRATVDFCDNTVGHGLEHIGIEPLEEELTHVPKKLKRNKVLVGYISLPLMVLSFTVVIPSTVMIAFATRWKSNPLRSSSGGSAKSRN